MMMMQILKLNWSEAVHDFRVTVSVARSWILRASRDCLSSRVICVAGLRGWESFWHGEINAGLHGAMDFRCDFVVVGVAIS